jgi:glycosyltransferase involved in cell wall biosynthesis
MLREELKIKDSPLIGAVGRLTEQKGFDYLLEAFARVRDNVNEAHLVIAGDGERRHALESKARLLNIADAVHFLGWRNDVPSIMIDLDALIVPSLWEGFGLVTLEAMALSKPIVASNVSALPEIISHNETGLLVPPADSAALADSILNLLRDPEKAKTFGPRGRARLEKEFTIQRMAQRHVVVYKEAASRVPEFRA